MDTLQRTLIQFIGQRDMRFVAPMIRLIAEGRPVELERLAEEASMPVDRIESWLRAQPGTDWDDSGRLLGFGLTQRPTRHRFTVDGRVLFTFCAADTLIFTPVLGRPAIVESHCPATERLIRIEVTPEAVTAVDPATTVVSQLNASHGTADIRGSLCEHGHFFASEGAAAQWRRTHPDGDVLPVRDLFALLLGVCRELGWTN